MPLIKIDAGIGEISLIEPENLKLKMLVDTLKDHIEIYGVDKLERFFLGEENTDELKRRISELSNTVRIKENEMEELINKIDDEAELETIDCGIGTINYESDSIALKDIMENLDAAIQKTNFRKVNEILSAI